MKFYEHIIENPLFFRWVYYPSDEINAYWEQYLKLHPEQANEIKNLKTKFEQNFSCKEEKLTEYEKKILARKIIAQLDRQDAKKKAKINFRKALGYAAIGFLFALISGGLFYLYFSKNDTQQYFEKNWHSENIKEPILIIDNDEKIKLPEGKSVIQYSNNGQIIVKQGKANKRSEHLTNESELNRLLIPYGSRSEIILSDGSRVFLNAGSRLFYPPKFRGDKREVYLSGEAYFEVQENKLKPFILNTGEIEIEVLGTSFNVTAYPEDNSVQTALAEGSVKIKPVNGGLFKKEYQLQPGQLAVYDKKSEKTNISEVNIENYTLWTKGLFSFTETELNRIVKKLERYYNIKMHFEQPLDGMIQVTGKLDISQERDEVLEYLNKLTGLQFTQLKNESYVIK